MSNLQSLEGAIEEFWCLKQLYFYVHICINRAIEMYMLIGVGKIGLQWSPTRRDSAILWDKGTEVPSLSRGKGTSKKSCQGMGRAGTAQIRDVLKQKRVF